MNWWGWLSRLRDVSPAARNASDGSLLVFSSASGKWEPVTDGVSSTITIAVGDVLEFENGRLMSYATGSDIIDDDGASADIWDDDGVSADILDGGV